MVSDHLVQIGGKALFECKCVMPELQCFALGYGTNKKEAKADSAKKQIKIIAHIPDVESTIMSILMATRMNDAITGQSKCAKPKNIP